MDVAGAMVGVPRVLDMDVFSRTQGGVSNAERVYELRCRES